MTVHAPIRNPNNSDKIKHLYDLAASLPGDIKYYKADLKETPNGKFTEEIWNTTSSLAYGAYSYSKTVAEKEAWEIHDKQDQWDLVVINPTLVIGPGTNPKATSESFNIIKQFGDGSMKAGTPRVGFGVVDVRDLADAHFAGAFTPTAKGRHIVSGHNTDFVETASTLLEKYGDTYPIPRKALPKWLVWLVAPMVDKTLTRKWVANNVNVPWIGDNSKGKVELGVSYRPMKESMVDFFQQAIDSGLVPASK